MLRRITKAVGRMRVGEDHDYPRDVWNQVAASAKMSLDSFSQPVSNNPVLQSSLKGQVKIRSRLGAVH